MKPVFKPFTILKEKNMIISFLLWACFVLLIGQIEIFAAIICYWRKLGPKGILLNFSFGNLYIFAIACLSFQIYDYFSDYYKNQELKFRGMKALTGVIAFLLILIMVIIYSSSDFPLGLTVKQMVDGTYANLGEILLQLMLYLISIGFSIYMFCVEKLHLFSGKFPELEDFIIRENETMQMLGKKVSETTNDGGIAL